MRFRFEFYSLPLLFFFNLAEALIAAYFPLPLR